jgi:phosphocarrier protein
LPELQRSIEVTNRLGLHARAAAKLVTLASRFDAEIAVQRDERRVNAKSIMGVMMLAAARGTTLTLIASGPQAAEALEALEALIRDRFGEPE